MAHSEIHPQVHAANGSKPQLKGLLAEFAGPRELTEAAKVVRRAGFSKFDCYSPFPIHGIDDAMGTKRTILPFIVLACAFLGFFTATGLELFTNAFANYKSVITGYTFVISGKPIPSWPSNMPVMFELSVLFSAFGAFLGMLALNGLPALYNAMFRIDAFRGVTSDKFFLGIDACDPQFSEANIRQFIGDLHPLHIHDCYESGESKEIPAIFFKVLGIVGVFALVPLAIVFNLNSTTSNLPRFQIVQDMDFQPKLKTQRASNMFADGRGMRPIIPGTVARGLLDEDSEFHRGLQADKADDITVAMTMPDALDAEGKGVKFDTYPWVKEFPEQFVVSEKLMERGQERYKIYCAPCHGAGGYGDGLVSERAAQLMQSGQAAWVKPVSFHSDAIRNQPNGQLFNTISHGVRKMPAYGGQIPPADRWAIVLYVRALQKSQNASKQDIPVEEIGKMKLINLPGSAPAGTSNVAPTVDAGKSPGATSAMMNPGQASTTNPSTLPDAEKSLPTPTTPPTPGKTPDGEAPVTPKATETTEPAKTPEAK
jgi:mono/diheme cytochrome c family protein